MAKAFERVFEVNNGFFHLFLIRLSLVPYLGALGILAVTDLDIKRRLLPRLLQRLGQVLDLQAVVVVAPFAVRKLRRPAMACTKRFMADPRI
jgi:hypothetical protein